MNSTMRFFNADGDGTCLWQCPITPTTPLPRHGDEVTLGEDIEYEGFVTNVALWYSEDGDTMADITIKTILHDYEAGEAK